VLDFVNPIRTGRRRFGRRGQTRFDNSQSGAGTSTQRHSVRRYKTCFGRMQCGMRWNRPYPYDNDPTVRLGQMTGDAFVAIFVVYMVWGLFFN
jgi:hypothetical protein